MKKQLNLFADDCNSLRKGVDRAAAEAIRAAKAEAAEAAEANRAEAEAEAGEATEATEAQEAGEAKEVVAVEAPYRGLGEVMYMADESEARAAQVACQKLLDMPKDIVTILEKWQADPFWRKVQERQVLRYDPAWSLEICNGISCFFQMLRLGVPQDPHAKLVGDQACVVYLGRHPSPTPTILHAGTWKGNLHSNAADVPRSSIAHYSQLRQVLHAQMKELYARGYVTYSNLCNKAFQDLLPCCFLPEMHAGMLMCQCNWSCRQFREVVSQAIQGLLFQQFWTVRTRWSRSSRELGTTRTCPSGCLKSLLQQNVADWVAVDSRKQHQSWSPPRPLFASQGWNILFHCSPHSQVYNESWRRRLKLKTSVLDGTGQTDQKTTCVTPTASTF